MKRMFCSSLTPPHPFLYHLLLDRGTGQKQLNIRVFLVIQFDQAYPLKLGMVIFYCLCLSDLTLSLCHVSTVISHFYSYNVLNMFHTARPMCISFSKHETLTFVSGFMGKKSLIVRLSTV